MYTTGMVLRMYRLVFVSSCFLFYMILKCYDDIEILGDSEMLRLAFEKTIEYFRVVIQGNVTAAPPPPPPPPPPPKLTYDVSGGQNRYVRLP
jgi:hypothetical protein